MMRPPWLNRTQESAELEALQTDVMRFVAILGLCLAAIFSLVQSAAVEQQNSYHSPPMDTLPRESESVEPPETLPPPPGIDIPLAEKKPVVKKSREPGFTLEFSSPGALDRLLRGGSVNLYVRLEGAFMKFGPRGAFHATDAPENYYAMEADTVPGAYREALFGQTGEEPVDWGVTLPAMISDQLGGHMEAKKNGNLVIDGSGHVSLHRVPMP